MRDYKTKTKQYAKELRQHMTPEERRLWYDFLSQNSCHFRREQPLGNYIADFYASSIRLVVEVDGSQHFEETGQRYDVARSEFLRKQGVRVLRFTNEQIQRRFPSVCEAVERAISDIRAGKEVGDVEDDGHVY